MFLYLSCKYVRNEQAVFLLIGKTSALTMNIAGVIKDWMLIFFSFTLFHAPVTALNLAGYAFCCSGAPEVLLSLGISMYGGHPLSLLMPLSPDRHSMAVHSVLCSYLYVQRLGSPTWDPALCTGVAVYNYHKLQMIRTKSAVSNSKVCSRCPITIILPS